MAFSESLKKSIRKKAHLSCCLCKSVGIEIHHIIPETEGGPDTEEKKEQRGQPWKIEINLWHCLLKCHNPSIMARPYRLQSEDCFYHITSCGNDRKKIFFERYRL